MICKKDKGVAGLEVLMAVITMIFAIGMIVMIFAIMNAKILDNDTFYTRTGVGTISLETLSNMTGAGVDFSVVNLRGVACTVVSVQNASDDFQFTSGNWTQTNCNLVNATDTFGGFDWEVNYTYTYLADTSGLTDVVNNTNTALTGVTDWFNIIIIISAMVVLILLTVIIISAIKGVNETGGNNRSGNSGSA